MGVLEPTDLCVLACVCVCMLTEILYFMQLKDSWII